MERRTISRRDFVKGVGLASLGTVLGSILTGCQARVVEKEVKETVEVERIVKETALVEKAITATPLPLKGKLVCYLGNWTPTDSMERSEDNPTPHNKILEVLDDYRAMHPQVEIEWIKIPTGIGLREWMIVQQVAGTIPHITEARCWHLKEDTEKNWWVNLTPFLEQPNPYVPLGDPGSEKWINQFYPVPLSELMMRGGYYMLALGAVTTMMFYNVDMFDEFGIKPPATYAEFLQNCQVCREHGVIGYDGATFGPEYGAFWYRVQFGGMIMARDIEPLVNPGRDATTPDEIACAIARGDWGPWLPQYRDWMEKWKLNVPYRRADWTVPKESMTLFLTRKAAINENGSWAIAQLETDPLLDFEWSTYWAPTVTKETSEYVTDPPTPAWPIGGPVADGFAISTRALKDGVLSEAIDLFHWLCTPANVHKVQSEIGTVMPLVRGVTVSERFAKPHEMLTGAIGESRLFVYEANFMDLATAEVIGNQWWAYMLDETSLDKAINELTKTYRAYAQRYMEQSAPKC